MRAPHLQGLVRTAGADSGWCLRELGTLWARCRAMWARRMSVARAVRRDCLPRQSRRIKRTMTAMMKAAMAMLRVVMGVSVELKHRDPPKRRRGQPNLHGSAVDVSE